MLQHEYSFDLNQIKHYFNPINILAVERNMKFRK